MQGEIALKGASWGSIDQGVIFQEGNYSGVIIQRVIFLGRTLLGEVVQGVVVQGEISRSNFPVENSGVQLPWRNFMGSSCPRGSCPGGNVWIP